MTIAGGTQPSDTRHMTHRARRFGRLPRPSGLGVFHVWKPGIWIAVLAAIVLAAVGGYFTVQPAFADDHLCSFTPTDYADEMAEFVASGEMIREMDGVIMTSSSNGYYHLRNYWIEDDVLCIYIYRDDGTFDGPTIVRDDDFGEEPMLVPGSLSLSANGFHSCGLLDDGSVVCYGDNRFGQSSAPEGRFTQVRAGALHTCGLRTEGTVECWGNNHHGETDAPKGQFTAIAADISWSCGILSTGGVRCWGLVGPIKEVQMPEVQYRSIDMGYLNVCAVRRSDSGVDCWGFPFFGAIYPPAGEFRSIGVGYLHTCGVRSNGSVECWGRNSQNPADNSAQSAPVTSIPAAWS